jgi:hypothetical protein
MKGLPRKPYWPAIDRKYPKRLTIKDFATRSGWLGIKDDNQLTLSSQQRGGLQKLIKPPSPSPNIYSCYTTPSHRKLHLTDNDSCFNKSSNAIAGDLGSWLPCLTDAQACLRVCIHRESVCFMTVSIRSSLLSWWGFLTWWPVHNMSTPPAQCVRSAKL